MIIDIRDISFSILRQIAIDYFSYRYLSLHCRICGNNEIKNKIIFEHYSKDYY